MGGDGEGGCERCDESSTDSLSDRSGVAGSSVSDEGVSAGGVVTVGRVDTTFPDSDAEP